MTIIIIIIILLIKFSERSARDKEYNGQKREEQHHKVSRSLYTLNRRHRKKEMCNGGKGDIGERIPASQNRKPQA